MVAMSGGVDSSVAALILKKAGWRVVGATMRLLESPDPAGDPDPPEPRAPSAPFGPSAPFDPFAPLAPPAPFDPSVATGRGCCSLADVLDARRVAERLDFDHQVHNFSLLFRSEVIGRFVRDYLAGRTPNPCVDCNRRLKFTALFERARLLGLDRLATGHYARIAFDPGRGRWILRKALDDRKDQSYFLYGLTQPELSRTLFPLGDLRKDQVRALAAEAGLATARKPESQDICFVGSGAYAGFLESVGAGGRPGDVVDRSGRILGRHRGLHRYTVGQRRGLGLPGPEPLYVVALDPAANTVVAGGEGDLYARGATASDVNLISIARLDGPMEVEVKIRYRQAPFGATMEPLGSSGLKVVFREPQKAVAPGQAAVFYQGDEVVGGATIESSF
jgi:tRNA-specific 2-thiouridylase